MNCHLPRLGAFVYIFILFLATSFFFGCGNNGNNNDEGRSTSTPSTTSSTSTGAAGAQEPQLPSRLTLASPAGSALVINGNYEYTGTVSADAATIRSDIWTIAQQYPKASKLSIGISFVRINDGGDSTKKDVGVFEVADLRRVRSFDSFEEYDQDSLTTTGVMNFLTRRYSSPYYVIR